ncbi:MAG: hypothetical protein VKP62_08400 [Candidatus Sericytochromatia bacterium]|nr:hypothetical protein [Candidatus Sericytochromatia bacterium]
MLKLRGLLCAVGGILMGAALPFLRAEPAEAMGLLGQVIVAERAFHQLVPRHPWLAPHRDAMLWGALAGELLRLSGPSTMAERKLDSLAVRDAMLAQARQGGPAARAFVCGWLSHLESDAESDAWVSREGRLGRLAEAVGLPENRLGRAHVDLALDAVLLPAASQKLRLMAEAARRHAGTPSGAPVVALLRQTLGVDDAQHQQLAALAFALGSVGPDRYKREVAHLHGLDPYLDALTGASARASLSPATVLLTDASLRAAQRIRLLGGL